MRILTHTKEGKMCSISSMLFWFFSREYFLFHSIVNMSFFSFYLYSFEKLLLSHTQRDYHNSRMLLITISKTACLWSHMSSQGMRWMAVLSSCGVYFRFFPQRYQFCSIDVRALGFFCAVLESFSFKMNSLLCFEHSTMRAVSTTMMMTRHKERYGNGKLS